MSLSKIVVKIAIAIHICQPISNYKVYYIRYIIVHKQHTIAFIYRNIVERLGKIEWLQIFAFNISNKYILTVEKFIVRVLQNEIQRLFDVVYLLSAILIQIDTRKTEQTIGGKKTQNVYFRQSNSLKMETLYPAYFANLKISIQHTKGEISINYYNRVV